MSVGHFRSVRADAAPRRLAAALGAFWLATAPASALSQAEEPAADSAVAPLEEVVVTATKRETDLLETALSVSAFSQEQLDRQGVRNLLDLPELVPNMQVGLSPSDSGVQAVVRGLTSNNFTELGDPTVAMHFDGLYSPRPQGALALMYDTERVEIHRGPQGTLFGRNSTAGSVNVISARPRFDDAPVGKVDAELGSFGLLSVKGWINVPVNDRLALRASALFERADSWLNQSLDTFDLNWDVDGDGRFDGRFDVAADGIPNVDQRRARAVDDSDAYGAIDRRGLRVGGLWQPSEAVSLNLIVEHFQDNSPGGLSLKDCEKAENTFFACDHGQWDVAINVPGEMDFTINTLRSVLEWRLRDGLTLEHRLAYALQKRHQVYDGTIGDYADPDHPAYGIPRGYFHEGRQRNFGNLVADQDLLTALDYEGVTVQPWDDLSLITDYSNYDSLVTELQIKSDDDEPLRWIAGVFYMQEKNEIKFDVENPFCCGFVRPLAQTFLQPDRRITSIAAFAQADWRVNERLNATFGYRFTRDDKEDRNGANHDTVGTFLPNPGRYSPAGLPYNGYSDIGPALPGFDPLPGGETPTADLNLYQANDLRAVATVVGDETFAPDGTFAADFTARIPGTDNSHKNSWSQGTWKLGADYLFDENWFFYGYLATGFKAGGFGDSVDICDCGITTTADYDPEKNTTLELGFKTTLLDGRLNLIAAAFVTDVSDLQQTFFAELTRAGDEIEVPIDYAGVAEAEECTNLEDAQCVTVSRSIGSLITANIAEARSVGVELEFDWAAWEGGRVFGWVSWLNAEITDYDNAVDDWYCLERALFGLAPCAEPHPTLTDDNGNPIRVTSFKGNKLPWSPELSLTVNAEHRFYLPGRYVLSPYVSVHWQDEMFFDNSNFDQAPYHSGQPEFATADVALRLINEERRWAVELSVRNITDELVRTWADRGPGFLRASFAKPRTVSLKANYHF